MCRGSVKRILLTTTLLTALVLGSWLYVDTHEQLTAKCVIIMSEPEPAYLRSVGLSDVQNLVLVTFQFSLRSYSLSKQYGIVCNGEFSDSFKALVRNPSPYYDDNLFLMEPEIYRLESQTQRLLYLVEGDSNQILQSALASVFTIRYRTKGEGEKHIQVIPKVR